MLPTHSNYGNLIQGLLTLNYGGPNMAQISHRPFDGIKPFDRLRTGREHRREQR